jgi:RNA polymerase sigma-70 factor, ECF subfamily
MTGSVIESAETKEKQEAFMRLFRPVHARLSQYVHAMVADSEEARDILSETSLAAYEKFETLKDPGSFLFFLFTIARRKYKRGLWRRKIFRVYDESTHDTVESGGMSPEAQADQRLLHEALARLPAKLREAVTLFELTGLTLDEIARIQNAKLSAVKQRLRRGRFKLADLLGATTFIQEEQGVKEATKNMIGVPVQAEEEQQ